VDRPRDVVDVGRIAVETLVQVAHLDRLAGVVEKSLMQPGEVEEDVAADADQDGLLDQAEAGPEDIRRGLQVEVAIVSIHVDDAGPGGGESEFRVPVRTVGVVCRGESAVGIVRLAVGVEQLEVFHRGQRLVIERVHSGDTDHTIARPDVSGDFAGAHGIGALRTENFISPAQGLIEAQVDESPVHDAHGDPLLGDSRPVGASGAVLQYLAADEAEAAQGYYVLLRAKRFTQR